MPDNADTHDAASARRRAVALRYRSSTEQAPRVVASGSGHIADRILAIAREHGVPVHEDPNLVQTLSALDLGMEIPESLYRAVAEVLAFVYRINREYGAAKE